MKKDLAVTWPRATPLSEYLRALAQAKERGDVINYRVSGRPQIIPERCYMVYDGYVRGWNEIVDVVERGGREVLDPRNDTYWSLGWYIVRDPEWHPLRTPIPMRGFQGFRYIDRI